MLFNALCCCGASPSDARDAGVRSRGHRGDAGETPETRLLPTPPASPPAHTRPARGRPLTPTQQAPTSGGAGLLGSTREREHDIHRASLDLAADPATPTPDSPGEGRGMEERKAASGAAALAPYEPPRSAGLRRPKSYSCLAGSCVQPDEGEDDCCPTCLEEWSEENPKIMLRCAHAFHLSCIYEWAERSETCPVCGVDMV